MSGKSCCCQPAVVRVSGGGAAPTADPAACNSLTVGPDGLLVPRVELAGVVGDPPNTTGPHRSIDVDVAHVAGCPEQWNVGARLTPPSGFRNTDTGNVDLAAAGTGNTVPVPNSEIDLPESGTYHLDADVRYHLGTDTGAAAAIVGHLFDTTAGVELTSFTQIAGINTGAGGGQEYQAGTSHIMTEHAIGTAPRTVILRLVLFVFGGVVTTAEAGGTDSNGATRLRFLKIRD